MSSRFEDQNNRTNGITEIDAPLYYNDDIYFPYGFLRNSTLTDTIPFNISNPESAAADYKYTNLIEEKRETSGFLGSTITTTRKYAEYTDVTYTYSGTARVGAFLSQEGIIPFIIYLNIENFQLYSYSYLVHTQVHKTTITDWAGTTTDSYTEPETVYGKQVDAIVNQLKSRLPASHIGSECPENIISYNSNDRYQLRCVKE